MWMFAVKLPTLIHFFAHWRNSFHHFHIKGCAYNLHYDWNTVRFCFFWRLCVRELIWWFGWWWWRSAADASASTRLLASSCVPADGRCFWACVVRQAAVRSFQNSLCACLPGAFVPQLTFPLAVAFNSFICLWFTEEYTQLNSVHGGAYSTLTHDRKSE